MLSIFFCWEERKQLFSHLLLLRWQTLIGHCTFHIINPQFSHLSIYYSPPPKPPSLLYISLSPPRSFAPSPFSLIFLSPQTSRNASDDQKAEHEKKSSRRIAMEPLPLFVGDGTDAVLFSSLWSLQEDLHQQPQESVAELKQSLVATTLELEAAKDELKKKEQSIAKLADLVRQVAKERDDARDQLQQLLLAATATAPAPRVTSSVTDSDCSLVSSPVDPFFDPVTSADKRCCKPSPTATPPTPPAAAARQQQQPLAGSAADAVLDMLASKRPLPQKGRLLAAVMEAGPLLQNLLVAGQLPRWRNPPTVHAPDALALRAGYVGATTMPGGAQALGYGGANACMKRPVSMLPLTPMAAAAANCSPGFVSKRLRLH